MSPAIPARLRTLLTAWNWDTATHIVKTAFAVSLAWALCDRLFPWQYPIFGPIAALLVVQGTVYQTFRLALTRSVGVVAGVVLALGMGHWLGVHAWSIGIIVACGLTVGRILNLGTQSIQVAVSALLVLAVSGLKRDYAAARILETVLGGGVGVAVHLLVRPPVHVGSAQYALRTAAHNLGIVLHRIGMQLRRGDPSEAEAMELLLCAREQTKLVRDAGQAVDSAEDSLRFNFKHRATLGDSVGRLEEQLGTLERLGVQTRSVARALHDMSLGELSWDDSTRSAVAECLLACALDARRYGDLVDGQPEAAQRLREALLQTEKALDSVTAALAANAEQQTDLWEIDGSVQTSLRRFHDELRLALESG